MHVCRCPCVCSCLCVWAAGSFRRIQHVLLVGVGGGVPQPQDWAAHSRRGDVVVSYPVDESGAVYLHCDKVGAG